ncbi:trypsin-like peptidase domain-containing protein [Streptomyces sp. MBT65]|uniref:trypsin-like serine peptidase n=1 Tax=Streptomyces sp. MBT65 TaxID=1488395 RepID=UPI00190CB8C6|nr:serine protease [Streptomyces sp. MBT65]MBK3576292.1 trypsin-like peptidase domain-containing protein [Streptomyces sp. MBT65]
MDYRQVFSDEKLRTEFLDRFDEIRAAVEEAGGLEGLDGVPAVDQASEATDRMVEGSWQGDDSGLEAIILRFTRPVHLVQRGTFRVSPDGFPESEEIGRVLAKGRAPIERCVPGVGRLELRNHRLDWAGTGWLAGPGLVVTNRHVAQEFATAQGDAFAFRSISGRRTHALIDWRCEYLQPEESRFRVTEVLWIEPDASLLDVALLRISETGEDGEAQPAVLGLLDDTEFKGSDVGRWVAVVGYPGNDSRADRADRQRIFDGIYDCKRLAAGQVTAVEPQGLVHHDATTLGGNSGSAVIDLDTGKALALHFDGKTGVRNRAVGAAAVKRLISRHAS